MLIDESVAVDDQLNEDFEALQQGKYSQRKVSIAKDQYLPNEGASVSISLRERTNNGHSELK